MSARGRSLQQRAELHALETPDERDREQIRAWLRRDDDAALTAAFEPPLSFGTAGVRAQLGPGDARINRLTVRRLVSALCEYLREQNPSADQAGLCVGFDGRQGSATFAEDARFVATTLGFRVRIFTVPVPTPLLAHATARHGAAAGVMITASHNPAGDNGVKVFWAGGRPLLSPHDAAIAARMPDAAPPTPAERQGKVDLLGESDLEAYLDALCAALPPAAPDAPRPRITYSAMCGVGAPATRQLLARLSAGEVREVKAECTPDPAFADLVSPNPEHPRALEPSFAVAMDADSDLVLVHDPDADRLAVGVPSPDGYVRLSGDEVGCLLADYLLSTRAIDAPKAALVTTLVSSQLSAAIATHHGALHRTVPTGVKWIAQQGRALEAEGLGQYVFGYEEALGYCLPALGDDKDGLAALALVLRCWQHHRLAGRDLLAARDRLFCSYGVHRTLQRTWRFASPQARLSVVQSLGAHPPERLGEAHDPALELDPRAPDLRVLRYAGEGGALRVALRPSDTEPKLKAYLELVTPADSDDVAARIAAADAALSRAADDLDRAVQALA